MEQALDDVPWKGCSFQPVGSYNSTAHRWAQTIQCSFFNYLLIDCLPFLHSLLFVLTSSEDMIDMANTTTDDPSGLKKVQLRSAEVSTAFSSPEIRFMAAMCLKVSGKGSQYSVNAPRSRWLLLMIGQNTIVVLLRILNPVPNDANAINVDFSDGREHRPRYSFMEHTSHLGRLPRARRDPPRPPYLLTCRIVPKESIY